MPATLKQKMAMKKLFGPEAAEVVPADVPPPLPKGLGGYSTLRWLVEHYYAAQHHRIKAQNRLGALARMGMPEDDAKAIREFVKARMEREENEVRSAIQRIVDVHPLWEQWLIKVRGVGPCIAGGLIAWLGGPHYSAISEAEAAEAGARGWTVAKGSALLDERVDQEADEKEEGDHGEAPRPRGAGFEAEQWYRIRQGIGAFDTVSQLWTYCGLGMRKDGTAQRREIGVKAGWSANLKRIAGRAADCFEKISGGYRDLYDREKARLLARAPETRTLGEDPYWLRGRLVVGFVRDDLPVKIGTILTTEAVLRLRKQYGPEVKMILGWRPMHVRMQTKRWVAKIFLAHVWVRWRQIQGLPTRLPYAVEKLGHKTEIPVVED